MTRDGGTVYVGIERVHRIVRFDYGKEGLTARGRPIDAPPAVRSLPNNGSIEALVAIPRGRPLGGTLIAISERGHDREGNHRAFLIGGPRPGEFTIRRKNEFDVSDVALLPSGDLVLLERKFGWTDRALHPHPADCHSRATSWRVARWAGFAEADLGQQIDNFEGISVHRSGEEVVLTLLSDNNFSGWQRTMLMQFSLAKP